MTLLDQKKSLLVRSAQNLSVSRGSSATFSTRHARTGVKEANRFGGTSVYLRMRLREREPGRRSARHLDLPHPWFANRSTIQSQYDLAPRQ